MKRVKMSDIEAVHPLKGFHRILVRGGWHAHIPRATPTVDTYATYSQYYRSLGASEANARKLVEQMIDQLVTADYVHKLQMAIKRQAQAYAEAYPDLHRLVQPKFGHKRTLLVGFDPEKAQQNFVPGDRFGRAGKSWMKDSLREMATSAQGASDE